MIVAVSLGVRGTLDEARKADRSDANIREEARQLAAWIRESGAESVAAVVIGLVGFGPPPGEGPPAPSGGAPIFLAVGLAGGSLIEALSSCA